MAFLGTFIFLSRPLFRPESTRFSAAQGSLSRRMEGCRTQLPSAQGGPSPLCPAILRIQRRSKLRPRAGLRAEFLLAPLEEGAFLPPPLPEATVCEELLGLAPSRLPHPADSGCGLTDKAANHCPVNR